MENKKIFAARLKSFRERRALSQRAFAKLLTEKTVHEFSRQNISGYENATSYPPVEFIPGYAKLLEVTLNEFFGEKPSKEAFRKIDLRKNYKYGIKRQNLRLLSKVETQEITRSLYDELDNAHKEIQYLKNYMISQMMK